MRMAILRLLFAVACLCALGCMPAGRYSQTGPVQPTKGEECQFQVMTTPPAGDYVEIGVIDVDVYPPTTIEGFKKMATKHVCKAGGDAVIAMANGNGVYIKGAVLKRLDAGAAGGSQQPQPPPPVVVAPPVAGEQTAGGCQYDTQCKGDRVCVNGTCAAPAPASPPASQ